MEDCNRVGGFEREGGGLMVTEKIFRLGYVRRICVVVIAAGVCLLHASVAAAIDSHSANDRSTFKVPIIAETDVRTPVESNITTWIEVISWTPRLIHIHGLLSPDECDYMVTQGNKTIQRSTVVGDQGEPIVSEIRTSKVHGWIASRTLLSHVSTDGSRSLR